MRRQIIPFPCAQVQRLMSFNDHPSAAIVDMIGLQEKAHVAVGKPVLHWKLPLGACEPYANMLTILKHLKTHSPWRFRHLKDHEQTHTALQACYGFSAWQRFLGRMSAAATEAGCGSCAPTY